HPRHPPKSSKGCSMSSPVLGIVCGMQTEAHTMGRKAIVPGVLHTVSGARPELAEEGANWLADQGCRLLVSYGVSGGLDPDLKPGQVLRPQGVVGPDGVFELSHSEDDVTLFGSDQMVLTPDAKQELRARTGAAVVDMESHVVARVASERGLAMAALRAVGDPAGSTLPPFVTAGLSPTGHQRPWPVIWGLIQRPGWLPTLMQLKKDTDKALRALTAEVEGGAIDRLLEAVKSNG
ncbi:MAG: hypothetical protein AAGC81_11915, partial [Pseudomonadota bacterium]